MSRRHFSLIGENGGGENGKGKFHLYYGSYRVFVMNYYLEKTSLFILFFRQKHHIVVTLNFNLKFSSGGNLFFYDFHLELIDVMYFKVNFYIQRATSNPLPL